MTIRFISKLIAFPSLMTFVVTFAHSQEDNLLQAIKNNSGTGVQQVLMDVVKHGQNETTVESILLKAIMTGTAENIKQAVQPIIEQGKNNISPITWAVLLKKPEAVKTLIECGAKIDSKIIDFTMKMNDLKIILEIVKNVNISNDLLSDDEQIDDYKDQILDHYARLAVRNFYSDKTTASILIKELSAKGYDANKIWHYVDNNLDLIKFIVKNGANVNYQDINSRELPLRSAVSMGYLEIVKFLVDAGADINPKDQQPDDRSLLSIAIDRGFSDIIEFLLEHGASL